MVKNMIGPKLKMDLGKDSFVKMLRRSALFLVSCENRYPAILTTGIILVISLSLSGFSGITTAQNKKSPCT